jgi:DNA-binding helix-turn-helix protein
MVVKKVTDKSPGEKLRDIRMACHLSQERFGNALGITKSSINAYEHNINPIHGMIKFKIIQATGIGWDYFDTNMDFYEACEKYKLNPEDLKLRSLTECIVSFYDSVTNFVAKEKPIEQKSSRIEIIDFITKYKNSECCLVKVKGGEGGFIAQEGDILVILTDEKPLTGEWIIVKYADNAFIVQFLIASRNKVRLKSFLYDFELSDTDFNERIEVIGIIKSKISISTKIQETIPDYLRK